MNNSIFSGWKQSIEYEGKKGLFVIEGIFKVPIVSRILYAKSVFHCEFCINDCISRLDDGHVDIAQFTVVGHVDTPKFNVTETAMTSWPH